MLWVNDTVLLSTHTQVLGLHCLPKHSFMIFNFTSINKVNDIGKMWAGAVLLPFGERMHFQ